MCRHKIEDEVVMIWKCLFWITSSFFPGFAFSYPVRYSLQKKLSNTVYCLCRNHNSDILLLWLLHKQISRLECFSFSCERRVCLVVWHVKSRVMFVYKTWFYKIDIETWGYEGWIYASSQIKITLNIRPFEIYFRREWLLKFWKD